MNKPKTYTPAQIRDLRERLRLTQAEICKRVAVSQNLWSAWEKGTRKPSKPLLILLRQLDEGKL